MVGINGLAKEFAQGAEVSAFCHFTFLLPSSTYVVFCLIVSPVLGEDSPPENISPKYEVTKIPSDQNTSYEWSLEHHGSYFSKCVCDILARLLRLGRENLQKRKFADKFSSLNEAFS